MRLVFMGTPRFAIPTLEQLISRGHELVAVYTQPDKAAGRDRQPTFSPVKKVALEHGLTVLQPHTLRDPAEVTRLALLQPDAIVVAAFGQLLPGDVLSIPSHGCLNLHPSLLPRHRGASPVATAILEGTEETGSTIMLLDEGMDTGPILSQRAVRIAPQDNTESLTTRLSQVGAELLVDTLPRWLAGELTPVPQDEGKATYTHTIGKEDGEINWRLTAVELGRRVRAFYPWPGCYTRWEGRLLKVLEAVPLPRREGVEPGRVVTRPDKAPPEVAFGVQTGEGVLGIRQVQLEGKRAMSSAEFLRGQRKFEGALL